MHVHFVLLITTFYFAKVQAAASAMVAELPMFGMDASPCICYRVGRFFVVP
uniref:Secreted protein n=1 Tax=Arundo donax TaxID=35708 RepID=A0A0A9FW72_ARUDO